MLNLAALAVALSTTVLGTPSRAFSNVQIGQEPNRPFTDLGPVQAPDVSREPELRQKLQLLADQIGVDGFIIETRNPMIVYGMRPAGYQGNRDDVYAPNGADGSASDAVEALGLSTLRSIYGMKKAIVFLRAYSFASLPPDKTLDLQENAKKLFKGEIKIPEMNAMRKKLLAN